MPLVRSSRRRPALVAAVIALVLVGAGVAGTQLASAASTSTGTSAAAPAAATAGCGKTPTLTTGTHTIQSSGQTRSYILNVPTNYDSSHPYRLIFGFHWVGGTATDVATGRTVQPANTWAYYGLLRLSNNSTIFVAPQGLNNGWANTNGQDITFVDDMVRQIEGDLCVDTSQLFSVGFSYGAAMTYAVACARANVFRAVAVQSGGTLSGCSGGTTPIAYLGVHGIRDGVLNIAGGRSLRDRFVRNNGCTAQNPPEPAQGSYTHIVTAYSGCSAGHPVVWAAFDEGHIAAPHDGGPGDNGSTTWVPALEWQFFTQFQSTSPTPGSPTPGSPTPGSPTPPGSPSPSVTHESPTPSQTAGGGSSCRVSAAVNAWNTGLTENITVTNTGTSTVNGWSLAFTLPGGQTITNGWNASYSPSSGQVTARNASYNGTIAPGGSVSIGFQATHTGNTATPTAFTLNGAACTTG